MASIPAPRSAERSRPVLPLSGALPMHSSGRVSRNTVAPEGRTVTVTDFEFEWPNSANRITRLDIALSGSVLIVPTASVTFVDVAQERQFGPFHVQQRSPYYHEVEVDIDREADAVTPEPFSTHIHPDRPGDLAESTLTLESAFAAAGVRITRTVDGPAPITGAGSNHRWNYSELHDSMVLHWEAYANRPQWKMWIFLAGQADDDGLGGVMFDGDIDEPGGVDREDRAVHAMSVLPPSDGGLYAGEPPAAEAARRELFFKLIHEVGHGSIWRTRSRTSWWCVQRASVDAARHQPASASWMNYPNGGRLARTPMNASGFTGTPVPVRRGSSCSCAAPERYVQMGPMAWFDITRVYRVTASIPRLHSLSGKKANCRARRNRCCWS